jgi:hypothetical protein
MGYHADIMTALKTLLETTVSVEVIDGLTMTEAQATRLSTGVVVVRDAIHLTPHPEINPLTAVEDQPEEWWWSLYVIGGGGGSRSVTKAAHVDLLLEQIRTGLNAQRLTSDCGPLHLEVEEFIGHQGTGVMYLQRWRHTRLKG